MQDFELYKVVKEPDNEHVVLRVLEDCNLSRYILMDNTYDSEGNISNIHRHSLILPNINVNKGDYLRIYTHVGKQRSFINKSKTITHEIFWGFDGDISIWNDTKDKAYIYKIESRQMFNV